MTKGWLFSCERRSFSADTYIIAFGDRMLR